MKWTDKDKLEPLLPKEGFLGSYLNFSKNLQACARFRFFSAICVLGSAVNNKVWIQRGDEGLLPKLFPNPWVMLLGPPGYGNKTQTINMAVNCLMQSCDDVKILSDKLTPESLVKALSEPVNLQETIRVGPRDATGLIKAPELSVVFGKQQYNTGMVSLITDLYDYREEWVSETIMRGRNVLKHICISILGGSTPDWLQSMLPQDAFTGGFMSRFIMVEMPPTYLKMEGWPTKPDTGKQWDSIVEELCELSKLRGVMEWSDEAREMYIEHYEKLRPTGDRQKDAYRVREVEQILKVAMGISLSHHSLVLKGKYYAQAQHILDGLMEETEDRIVHLTTVSRMTLVQEIRDLLQKFGEMSEQKLIRRFYRVLTHGEQQFHEAISILMRAGIIERRGKMGTYTYTSKKEDRDGPS
jgi:hypothetical protein